MSTSPLFWLRPLSICLTSQLYLWEYIWSSQQILISLFGFLQIKAHSSKFNLVFRSHSVLESLRKFGLALNLWKWQCSEGVVWFGFNELFLSLFPDNSWCPWGQIISFWGTLLIYGGILLVFGKFFRLISCFEVTMTSRCFILRLLIVTVYFVWMWTSIMASLEMWVGSPWSNSPPWL